MMLPTTYAAVLMLSLLSMVCWGSWANTVKASKWRFELYYFDYTLGLFLASVLFGFTFGSTEGEFVPGAPVVFSFLDNLSIAFRRTLATAAVAGAIFNLANMLLVAAIQVAGISVAFPVGIGLALIIGVILNYVVKPAANPYLLFGGVGVVLAAIVCCAAAYRAYAAMKAREEAKAAPPPVVNPLKARPTRQKKPSAIKGIVLSIAAGILMGTFYPILEMSKKGDFGLGPYAAAFCFAVGVLFTTPVYSLFFMNLPVQGEAVGIRDYFRGTMRQHALGFLGGFIWCAGAVANFVSSSAPPSVNVGPAVAYAIGQGATLVSTLWGLLYWHEFAGANAPTKRMVLLTVLLFVAGLALVSLAPLYK